MAPQVLLISITVETETVAEVCWLSLLDRSLWSVTCESGTFRDSRGVCYQRISGRWHAVVEIQQGETRFGACEIAG